MRQKPYLNLGCGRVILPGLQPGHHGLVDPGIYQYALWHNVDRNQGVGVDEVVDVFTYPWPWADNSFDGALLAHLCEHIPHEIRLKDDSERAKILALCQDGWYAFFAELHRVLTPGAGVHVLAPYAWSAGAMTDPSHTRYLTEHTFTHSMAPDEDSPFKYETGGLHFRLVADAVFGVTEMFRHLMAQPEDAPSEASAKQHQLMLALQTRINVAYDLYVRLEAVK